MSRRRTKTALEQMFDEVQLQGIIARFDGTCFKCGEQYLARQSRIVRVPKQPDRYMHVSCANGWEDER